MVIMSGKKYTVFSLISCRDNVPVSKTSCREFHEFETMNQVNDFVRKQQKGKPYFIEDNDMKREKKQITGFYRNGKGEK